MDVYLLDGTYELFRHFFALPSHRSRAGEEVAATRGVLASVLGILEARVTHLGVATDHVIESFRNQLWAGYKTGEGIDPLLRQQFPLLEDGLTAMGVTVWPMLDLEADDALAIAAAAADADASVDQVFICSPDKDLAQCVRGQRVLQQERRSGKVFDEDGVIAKFGVPPASIADYLALTGDSSDGYPGLSGWGARSAATVLARFGHIESIPAAPEDWGVVVRGSQKLAETLQANRELALLFKDLATLRREPRLFSSVEGLRWQGPTSGFDEFCRRLEAPQLAHRAWSLMV